MKLFLACLMGALTLGLNAEAKPNPQKEPPRKADHQVKHELKKPGKTDIKEKVLTEPTEQKLDLDGFMMPGRMLKYRISVTEETSQDMSADASWKAIPGEEFTLYQRVTEQEIACGVESANETGKPNTKDYKRVAKITCDEHTKTTPDIEDMIAGCWTETQTAILYDKDCKSVEGKEYKHPIQWKQHDTCPTKSDKCEFHTKEYPQDRGRWCTESESLIGDGYKTKDCFSDVEGVTERFQWTEGQVSRSVLIKLLNPINRFE